MVAKKNVGKPSRRPAVSRAGDMKLLKKVAEVILGHPEMNGGEALESLGVDDLVTQRRIRRAFEAKREHLLTVARLRADQIGNQDRAPRAVALGAPKGRAISSSASTEKKGSAVPSPARGSSGMAISWVRTGFEAYASAIRAQSAVVRAWTWFPAIVFSLQQRAMNSNMGLGKPTRV